MNAASFPVNSKGWSAGLPFNTPSAVFSSGVPGQRGVPSMSQVNWANSSNSGNSFFTQGRVNIQVQLRVLAGAGDECGDWHRQLYRQPVFAYIPPTERDLLDKKQFLLQDRATLLYTAGLQNMDESIYQAGYHNNNGFNDEGAPIVSVMTVSQINYKLHVDAKNGKEWGIDEVKKMFVFLGIAITPDHTMEPYNGDGVLHCVIQRSGLNDVYNMWLNTEQGLCPRKGDNCYILVRPVKNETKKYELHLSFNKHTTVEVNPPLGGPGNPVIWRWEFFPYYNSNGIDPDPTLYKMPSAAGFSIYGDYYHVGRVDEVLAVQNLLDGGDLDIQQDFQSSVVNLVRSRNGLVMNLTARRNIPIHF